MNVTICHHLGVANIDNLDTTWDGSGDFAIASGFIFDKNITLVQIPVNNTGRC
jgi:hypothetical protein